MSHTLVQLIGPKAMRFEGITLTPGMKQKSICGGDKHTSEGNQSGFETVNSHHQKS